MLQQTQVRRVVPAYQEFLRQYPTLVRLARARPAAIIRAWRGLGYNRRALNLWRAAKTIVDLHGGALPRDEQLLQELPGIGRYTARAIGAFAWNAPVLPQDTNVLRIIARVFRNRESLTHRVAERLVQLLVHVNGGGRRGASAFMDLGASHCTSRRPACADCPLRPTCRSAPRFLAGVKSVRRRSQSPRFETTDRFLRGRILDLLRLQRASTGALQRLLAVPRSAATRRRVGRCLKSLQRDGLIVSRGRRSPVWQLPT